MIERVGEEPRQARALRREHPGQAVEDECRFDVDEPARSVVGLEPHDETQYRIELLFAAHTSDRLGETGVEGALLVIGERDQQLLLARKITIERGPRNARDRRHRRHAELLGAESRECVDRRVEQAQPRHLGRAGPVG